MYWHIGERIFTEEQHGKDRADYGKYSIRSLAEQLEPEFGSGFGRRQLELMRQFYRSFPIANTLYSQLSWSHYKLVIRLDNKDKQAFYIAETSESSWTVRQLERQINSQLYERLLLSNDKASVLAVPRNRQVLSAKARAKNIYHHPAKIQRITVRSKNRY